MLCLTYGILEVSSGAFPTFYVTIRDSKCIKQRNGDGCGTVGRKGYKVIRGIILANYQTADESNGESSQEVMKGMD